MRDSKTGLSSALERERIAALRAYGVLHTQPETEYDEIAVLAARLCEAPIALVSLVAEDEQWFKARVGLDACSTGRDVSFCDHAMRGEGVMVVPDATLDPRFAENGLVTGPPHIRFYAGAPLVSADGQPLGSLCVIDSKPRPKGLTDLQAQALTVLAHQVQTLMELRKVTAQDAAIIAAGARRIAEQEATALRRDANDGFRDARDVRLAAVTRQLAESDARFQAIADSMPQMVWSTLPDGFHDYYNARWYEFTGVPAGSTDGEGWNEMFHPDDRQRAWALWRHSLATGELYEIEYRLRHRSGVYRWTLGRAVPIRDETGVITRWFGTCTDIDDLKRMEQSKELLSQELSHRIKNIFAVVSALIALSARQFPEAKAFASAVRTRINALARAHEFVRPHTETSRPLVGTTTLHAFLNDLFKAYAGPDGAARVRLNGDDATFDDQAATSVALLFHELATNAAKYGALSVDGGHVELDTRNEGDRFILTWREMGGPEIVGPPQRSGFGSSLATLSVEGQLGGRLERNWASEGLRVVADLPATALSRRRAALVV
ncbi:PAS domain-containing protein [Brevundimonas sp.]|uniref:PAS domain-containing protein n=1 Tax=Brevundimonas sp. TaxID=1871086 RepID=UPI002EDB299F